MKKLFINIINNLKLLKYLFSSKTIFIRRFSNGMGDNLLLSAVLPEIKKKYKGYKIVVESDKWCELFENNPYVDWATDKHFKTTKRHFKPKYLINNETQESIYLQIGKKIGVNRELYPELFLNKEEIDLVKQKIKIINNKPILIVCPQGKRGYSGNRKEWGFDNFQNLVSSTKYKYSWFQIGVPSDNLLKDVIDARDLSIRHTGALIKLSHLFIGLEGGIMHLAKSVDTSSVIIYGGVISPIVSGYKGNENVYINEDCSPCFRSDKPLDDCLSMKCMKQISVEKIKDIISNKLNEDS